MKEETGYEVSVEDLKLVTVVKLEGGYQEDWVSCYFKVRVPDKKIPRGSETEDGKLIWLNKDKVLDSEYDLVDDLNYVFKEIVLGKKLIFMTAKLDDDQKIISTSISELSP